jgi:hypothetical protein
MQTLIFDSIGKGGTKIPGSLHRKLVSTEGVMNRSTIAKELLKIASSLIAEIELPEDPWKYFKKVPDAIMIEVKDLETIRARPTGIEHAEKHMENAYKGIGEKRKPISVVRKGNKWMVFDGNSTTAIAKKHGWKQIPVLEVDEQGNYVKDGGKRVASKLEIVKEEVDERNTKVLQSAKKLKARSQGHIVDSIQAAGYYAKKHNRDYYVYYGNSYGHAIWNIGLKSDALSPVNNTSDNFVYKVSPDLVITKITTKRGY